MACIRRVILQFSFKYYIRLFHVSVDKLRYIIYVYFTISFKEQYWEMLNLYNCGGSRITFQHEYTALLVGFWHWGFDLLQKYRVIKCNNWLLILSPLLDRESFSDDF